MMMETVLHSVGSHPSLPRTLPPTTMGFGRMGAATVKDIIRHNACSLHSCQPPMGVGWRGTPAALLNEVRCFPHHGKRDVCDNAAKFVFLVKNAIFIVRFFIKIT